ncbi:uncharacterized protein LOC135500567 isoform X2 [Lineus longissimus]
MDGAPKIKQTNNLQKQMAAFEKLTEHANSKFSRDKLYEMLYMVSNGVPYLRGNKIQLDQAGNRGLITSIRQLRELHATINGRKRKGLQKEEEAVIMKFFETFFKDLQYLKNLKAYFDERIYCVLYEYFYDPLDISVNVAASVADDASRDQDSDSGHSSQTFSDEDRSPPTRSKHEKKGSKSTPRTRFNINTIIHDIGGGAGQIDENLPREKIIEREKLIQSVHELYEVNRSWEAILTEEDLNVGFFDPDSVHEIARYKDVAKFELVLRLIPDIFTKCFKSITLAKVWWNHAAKIYKESLEESSPVDRERTYDMKVSEFTNKVSRLGEDIVREEQQVIVYENDLRKLRMRENRVTDLNSESEKLESRKERAEKAYKDTVHERERLKEALENTIQGTVKYNKVAMDLRSAEERLVEQHEEVKLLEYHLDILKGDYNVELEVRPSFMRFTDSLQDKISELEKSVAVKKVDKRKIEKTLVLMRTNREKMREIMTKFVRTPSSISTRAATAQTDETPASDGLSQPESVDRESTEGPDSTFFLTQDAQLSERSDKRTQAAVQQRLKLLYKDYDFDSRFRPSSVASDVTDAGSDGNEADDETASGLRGPYVRPGQRGSRFNHLKPLGKEEYVVNSDKAQMSPSRIPRPAGIMKKTNIS